MILVWHDQVAREGWQQMALDRALLDRAASERFTLLRLYHWSRATVSFGANEAARRHWNQQSLEELDMPVVRRPTGGRAVWHEPEDLTYAVTSPVAAFGGVRQAYQAIHQRLADALETLQLATRLAETPARVPGLAAGSCFDVAVGGEVLVHGRKVIGSAQLVVGKGLLQHGEIARSERVGRLAQFALSKAVIPSGQATPALPAAVTMADAIASHWLALGATRAPAVWIADVEAASEQWTAHFRDPAWTWRR